MAIGFLLLLPACRHLLPGQSTAAFVDPSSAPPRDARELKIEQSMDIYVDAKPIEPLTMPHYPPEALAAHAGKVSVTVDLTVSTEGRVSEVAPDMLDLSGLSNFHDAFQAAVRDAVATWRFEPAQVDRVVPEPDGRPTIVGIEEQERVFRVLFKFSEQGEVSRSVR
jgi:TonB family protein